MPTTIEMMTLETRKTYCFLSAIVSPFDYLMPEYCNI